MHRRSANVAYLEMAHALAQRSTCIDKQVGCIIVDCNNIIIASGYNGSPRGFQHCIDLGYCIKERHGNPDLCPSAHAEQNALLQCHDFTMIYRVYLTLSPCVNCMRILLNTPCNTIFALKETKHPEPRHLWEQSGRRLVIHGIN